MEDRFSPRKLAMLGMMAALVFAGNFARIVMPVAIGGTTAFTLANIFCCLSGLLLGPLGGLAAGLGSALYDLTNPVYASECWITFLTKGALGLAAGLAVWPGLRKDHLGYPLALTGSVVGCAAYYALYFAKTYFYNGILLGGLAPQAALALLPLKVPASLFNAAVAIAAAPPLALTIRAALRQSGIKTAF